MQALLEESLQNADWLKEFGIPNPSILNDAVNYRLKDSHKLYKELDVCQRHVNCSTTVTTISAKCPQQLVARYLKLIIYLYCHCIESIKIARAIEKFLNPWKEVKRLEILDVYREYITEITDSESLSVDRLVALSNLLEQNSLARESVEGETVKILCWLQNHLSALVLTEPSHLTKTHSQNLYALVKIGLQLFLSCPAHTCEKVWFPGGGEGEVKDHIKSIFRSLLKILHSQHYAADCTILAGTALASLIVSAPEAQKSIAFFFYVFNLVNQNDFGQIEDGLAFKIDQKYSTQELTQDIKPKLGCISMIKGIIACSPQNLLLSKVHHNNSPNGNATVFLMELFQVTHELCSGPIHLHYHAFTLLFNWFQNLVRSCSRQDDLSPKVTLTSDLVVKTLQLVWLNWDSPVEDVTELMMSSLKCLLDFWDTVHSDSSNKERESISNMLQEKLRGTPWYTKGKYKVMEVLIPFLKLDELRKDEDLPQQLLKCLSTNYLAPSAGDIYKAYLQLFREKLSEEERVTVWKDVWLHTIEKGVTSSSWLVRSNIYHYWINSTMKILPSAGLFLQDYWGNQLMSNREDNSCKTRNLFLLAFISISKVIRGQLGKSVKDVDLLREAVYHSDEDIRSEAISLLCISLKKAEPLSDIESLLLREILPYNLKVDSAPFRQHLSANLKKLLVRIRDSCMAMLKAKQYHVLDMSLEFVDWLHGMCMVNLIPGSCYQRRKASLDILYIIYDTLIYDENVKQRKSFTPASVQKLFTYAKEKGCWNFFSFQTTVTLLHTVMDGADEIQESASNLLLQYCDWPLCPVGHLLNISPESLAGHLLTTGLSLCNSPKAHESQSGALLCKIVFQKYIIDLKWHFKVTDCDGNLEASAVGPSPVNDLPAPDLAFLTAILSHVQGCLKRAESNLVAASKNSPLHGYICTLTRCVSETSLLTGEPINNFFLFIHSLVDFNIEVINFMLNVMSKGAQNEACPSFAEIGEALESYIEENNMDYNTSTSLSVEHQYLLSWCWVNIKESCLSLGTLSDILITKTKADTGVIENIKSTFLMILTKCRHRGVIEGCRSAFIKFCSALFDSSDSNMNSLPQHLLKESFSTLMVTAGQTSTTRKSAGLPIIVQSVISCEKKLKKSALLIYTLEHLFEISSQPIPPDFDDRHDLPQVHGLNILKSLFSDASLSAVLMPHISKTVILVVDMFGSPAWAIRNAATRLFSSLVIRIFGQKKSVDDLTLNTLTLQELSSHYPELPPFITNHLDAALQRDITAIDRLHPSLFPVLTILASVGTTESSENEQGVNVDSIRGKIWCLLPSPVYYLRQLASSTYVALTSSHMTFDTVISLISHLTDTNKASGQINLLHSILLCVEKLINRNCLNTEEVQTVIHKITDTIWILQHPCDILRAKYVDTISLLYKLYPSFCGSLVHSCCNSLQKGEKGTFPITKMAMVETVFLQICNTGVIPSGLLEDLKKADVDSAVSIIKVLKKVLQMEKITADIWHKVQDVICSFALGVTYPPLLGQCLTLITDIHLFCGNSDGINTEGLWDRAREITDRQSIIVAPVLDVGAICIHQQIKQGSVNRDMLETLCCCVQEASEMMDSEDHRLSAARVLLVAGKDILQYCSEGKEECLGACVTQIFKTCLNLIQDDDTDIRDVGVCFLSNLHWPEKRLKHHSIQCNSCLQMWLDYYSDMLYWSATFIQDLMTMLYTPGNVQCVLKSSKKRQSRQLFEQDDNSFFAERLFTGCYIGKLLMRILSRLKQTGTTDILCSLHVEANQIILLEDLNYVYKELKACNENPLINAFSYPATLACVCHLLSYTRFVTELCTMTNTCEQTTTLLTSMYDCIVQNEFLPPGASSEELFNALLS